MVFNIHGRDISNGHFSEDNQKRINRPSSTDLPVFEAKMSRDLRLVVSFSYCDVSRQLLTFPSIWLIAMLSVAYLVFRASLLPFIRPELKFLNSLGS